MPLLSPFLVPQARPWTSGLPICLTPKPGAHRLCGIQLSQVLLAQCWPSTHVQVVSVFTVPSSRIRSPRSEQKQAGRTGSPGQLQATLFALLSVPPKASPPSSPPIRAHTVVTVSMLVAAWLSVPGVQKFISTTRSTFSASSLRAVLHQFLSWKTSGTDGSSGDSMSQALTANR